MIIPILYEDETCFVINKPNNVLVHHSYYARNIEEPSLIELLKEQGFENPVPVHRLDRKTSGVLLFVKNKKFAQEFQELFDNKSITKKYHALLRGHIMESGEIDSPVKNDRGNYKEAHTTYRCLQQFELPIAVQPYATARYSLVEFIPKTGRMHQLRIHANKISHPIIGDHKYGNRHHNKLFAEQLLLPDLFLHAIELTFTHPITSQLLTVLAEKPGFWDRFTQK